MTVDRTQHGERRASKSRQVLPVVSCPRCGVRFTAAAEPDLYSSSLCPWCAHVKAGGLERLEPL